MTGKTETIVAPLTLGEEHFGEKLHRAYRRGRQVYGYTYSQVAETVSAVSPVSGPTILRWEDWTEVPSRARWRAGLVYLILAYGYEPEEFGLSMDDLPAVTDRRLVRLLLDPSKRKYQ